MTGSRVLMVDDDEALRGSLAEQLQLHEEFETTTAGKRRHRETQRKSPW